MASRKKLIIIACILVLAMIVLPLFYHSASNSSEEIWGIPSWLFEPQGTIINALLDNDSRLFIQTTSELVSLDAHSGTVLWRADLPASGMDIVPMQLSAHVLIAQGQAATVSAYNADSGNLIWQSPPLAAGDWIDDMKIGNNILYVARRSAEFTAYTLNDGSVLWSHRVPNRERLFVFLYKDVVFLGASDSLQFYDADSGRLLSDQNLVNLVDSMTMLDKTIYIAFYEDKEIPVAAQDLITQEYVWYTTYQKPSDMSGINSIIIDNDVLYATGERLVATSTHDGSLLWISNARSSFRIPSFSQDYLYVTDNSSLYLIDKTTGQELGRSRLPGTSPLISFFSSAKYTVFFTFDNLIVTISRNKIYCFPHATSLLDSIIQK